MAKKNKEYNYNKEHIFAELIRQRPGDTPINTILKEVTLVYKELTR